MDTLSTTFQDQQSPLPLPAYFDSPLIKFSGFFPTHPHYFGHRSLETQEYVKKLSKITIQVFMKISTNLYSNGTVTHVTYTLSSEYHVSYYREIEVLSKIQQSPTRRQQSTDDPPNLSLNSNNSRIEWNIR